MPPPRRHSRASREMGLTPSGFTGEWMDKVVGLDGARAELVVVSAPDGSGRLELTKFHVPLGGSGAESHPANRLGFRHIAYPVEDLDMIVGRLQEDGYDCVGDVLDYGGEYRVRYVRGSEGFIVELADPGPFAICLAARLAEGPICGTRGSVGGQVSVSCWRQGAQVATSRTQLDPRHSKLVEGWPRVHATGRVSPQPAVRMSAARFGASRQLNLVASLNRVESSDASDMAARRWPGPSRVSPQPPHTNRPLRKLAARSHT